MRVLFLSQSAAVYGGAERWLADLCLGLQKRGVDVVLGLAKGPHWHKPGSYVAAYPELKSVPTIEFESRTGVPIERLSAAVGAIQRTKPDILIPLGLYDALKAGAALRSRNGKPKIVYPVHENDAWVYNTLQAHHDDIDAVVSVNRLFVKALGEYTDWPRSRLHHIRVGVPLAKKLAFVDHGGPLRLGYCGKLRQWQKRVRDLVPLCRELRDLGIPFELTIVGEGAEQCYLGNELSRWCINVEFLAPMSRNRLYEGFYPNIDLLLCFSDWETGPMVIWEAMMHGVVPVTSRYRGLGAEGLLTSGENSGVFPIGDARRAAGVVAEYYENIEKRRRCSTMANRTARRYLNAEVMEQRWNSVLNVVSASLRAPRDDGSKKVTGEKRATVERFVRRLLKRPRWYSKGIEEWPMYIDLSTEPNTFGLGESVFSVKEFDHKLNQLDAMTV